MKQILTLILITLGIATQAQEKNLPITGSVTYGTIIDKKGRVILPSAMSRRIKLLELEKKLKKQSKKSLSTAQKQALKENLPITGSVTYGTIIDKNGRIIVPSEISQRQKRLQQR